MFNWLFRNKEEVPDPIWKEEPVINDIPREYTDKGVIRVKSTVNKKNPWKAHVQIKKSDGFHQIHVGYFPTKEAAQKARWDYIDNLK